MSQPHKICPRCQTPADLQAPSCSNCGRVYKTAFPQNPDRTVLGATEPPPAYPATIEPPYYPAQPYQPEQPYYQPTQQPHNNQQVHVHVSAPQPAVYPAYVPEQRTDPCAVMSIIFGTLSLLLFCFFGWLFGLAGLILGIVSLQRLKQHDQLTGAPMAITGIVLSSLAVAFSLWWMYVWVSATSTPPPS